MESKFETKKHILGSGKIRIEEYNGTLPESWDTFFSSEENIFGAVKGGAELEYSVDVFEDQSDLGEVKIREITAENVLLRSGIMTINGETLKVLCETAEILNDSATNKDTIKIGGLSKKKDQRYIIGFEHYSKKLRIIIMGHNTAGFTISLKQDAATVVDVEFAAEALDNTGTLVIIEDLRYENASTAPARTKSTTMQKESLL